MGIYRTSTVITVLRHNLIKITNSMWLTVHETVYIKYSALCNRDTIMFFIQYSYL